MNTSTRSPHFGTIEAALDPRWHEGLEQEQNSDSEAWKQMLAVYTGSSVPPNGGQPPVAGTYSAEDGLLRFRPRYPFVEGLDYTARLDLGPEAGDPVILHFALAKKDAAPTTFISEIYPTASSLPENLLRFYLHFSAAMSRGEAYEHLRLVDESTGEEVLAPFVEITEELWDRDQRRLTLFFDPGRIKRGLRPHLEAGLPLQQGHAYRLIVSKQWQDAQNLPLTQSFEKRFQVVAADRQSPDPNTWTLSPPSAGTRDALELRFPEPLDRGLLGRLLHPRDGQRNPVEGQAEIDSGETRWRWIPSRAWQKGSYTIVVETILEDIAGNNLEKVFDVDTADSSRSTTNKTISLAFSI